jgi:hypothetical protein
VAQCLADQSSTVLAKASVLKNSAYVGCRTDD